MASLKPRPVLGPGEKHVHYAYVRDLDVHTKGQGSSFPGSGF